MQLLGKKTNYPTTYSSKWLESIPRSKNREALSIDQTLPFHGIDQWNAYEISWINTKGKPVVAIGQFIFPCDSKFLVESKSIKLYLNSFNQSKFSSIDEVKDKIEKDFSEAAEAKVIVELDYMHNHPDQIERQFQGICLDSLDVEVYEYEVNSKLLKSHDNQVKESLYTHLFKSNCLVTGQPDWASIFIEYEGNQVDHTSLLRYLISFRNHNEFHEQCIERIFTDIQRECRLEKLTVHGKFTRRGGVDINPWRSNYSTPTKAFRIIRQ